MNKTKKLLSYQAIAILSFAIMIALGVNVLHPSELANNPKEKTMHTYLVAIPASAGVCPYALMSMTNQRLKMVHDPKCVCPYTSNTLLMITRNTNIKSVIDMLPASIKNKVHIIIIDNLHKSYGKTFSEANFKRS